MRFFWTLLLVAAGGFSSKGDAFVSAPTAHGWQTDTIYPFLIKWTAQSATPFFSMRYQQVYNSSLFTNLDPSLIYVATLQFSPSPSTNLVPLWTVPHMQMNLSTTPKSADGLSTVFSENVGPDDMVVVGPSSYTFELSNDGRYVFQFTRPFRYNPALGNLLLDIRIFDATDPISEFQKEPFMYAFNSPTDEVSSVWATNVTATTATGVDTVGLWTLIQITPIPSLSVEFNRSLCNGCPSNLVVIRWPPQPTNFVLQRKDRLTPNAPWQPVTNQVFGSSEPQRGGWSIDVPASSGGVSGFYRLFWSGQ